MDEFKTWHTELKAEDLTVPQLDLWLKGERSRRILVVPFGGPLPGGKAGLDIDGEYFDDTTDLFGPFQELRRMSDRLVDWHHDGDPTGVMKGAILGRIVLDKTPEADGYWADFWANAGERRLALVAQLERKGLPLFGSSEAVATSVRKASDGHIEVWPLIRHTITTSPQNVYAVVPPLKALLELPYDADASVSADAVRTAMLGAFGTNRSGTLGTVPGERSGQGGGLTPALETKLNGALDALGSYLKTIA
jgi:hypothetical protein